MHPTSHKRRLKVRTSTPLKEKIEKRLLAYAVAATAEGRGSAIL